MQNLHEKWTIKTKALGKLMFLQHICGFNHEFYSWMKNWTVSGMYSVFEYYV